jgi:antitoxin PrlF
MIMGRITAKSQTTIPRAVRLALGLKPGDSIAYVIEGDVARVRRVAANGGDGFVNNFSTFSEWSDELDSVYDDLRPR